MTRCYYGAPLQCEYCFPLRSGVVCRFYDYSKELAMPVPETRRFNLHIGNILCVEKGEGEFFEFRGLSYHDLKYADVVLLEKALIDLLGGLNAAASAK